MKRRNAQSIGEVIAGFMQQEHSSQAALEMRASALWPEVVGPGVNRYTTNRWVRDGVLHIHLSSAALKNELMMMGNCISDIAKITGITPEVLTFKGMFDAEPPTMPRPETFLEY